MFEAKPQAADAMAKDRHPCDENHAAAKEIAEGSTYENQRAQEQAV
jgi:hypothetical protein